jgi:hypothetical protein
VTQQKRNKAPLFKNAYDEGLDDLQEYHDKIELKKKALQELVEDI